MRFLLASTALALLALPLAARAEESADKLVPVLRSRLVFDGVATTKDGRIFLPFRRQTPDQGIEVGEWVDGQPKPKSLFDRWSGTALRCAVPHDRRGARPISSKSRPTGRPSTTSPAPARCTASTPGTSTTLTRPTT